MKKGQPPPYRTKKIKQVFSVVSALVSLVLCSKFHLFFNLFCSFFLHWFLWRLLCSAFGSIRLQPTKSSVALMKGTDWMIDRLWKHDLFTYRAYKNDAHFSVSTSLRSSLHFFHASFIHTVQSIPNSSTIKGKYPSKADCIPRGSIHHFHRKWDIVWIEVVFHWTFVGCDFKVLNVNNQVTNQRQKPKFDARLSTHLFPIRTCSSRVGWYQSHQNQRLTSLQAEIHCYRTAPGSWHGKGILTRAKPGSSEDCYSEWCVSYTVNILYS